MDHKNLIIELPDDFERENNDSGLSNQDNDENGVENNVNTVAEVSADHEISADAANFDVGGLALAGAVVGDSGDAGVAGQGDRNGSSAAIEVGTLAVSDGGVAPALQEADLTVVLPYVEPQALIDALRFGTCSLAAHDNTLWAASLADQRFAQRFEEKVALDDSGWGIGIRKDNSDGMEHLLSLIVVDFYRSGVLTELVGKYPLPKSFITAQNAVWSQPTCLMPNGDPAEACMLPAYSDVDVPTAFAPEVRRIETLAKDRLGLTIGFPMLTGKVNFEMFLEGIVNTLVLVAGAISVTLFVAIFFQAGLRRGSVLFGTAAKLLTAFFRSSPVILLMLLGYYLVSSVTTYGTGVALCTAILAIGLTNGCFAGVAIADAATSMQDAAGTQPLPLVAVLHRARTQITAFMVNAARASAVAAFIGTPELLNTLNDIASVSSERTTTFAILLLFYMAIIWAVARLSGLLGYVLTRQGAAS